MQTANATAVLIIDSGIQIPKKNAKSTLRYPWKEMKVGDSFILPDPTARAAAYQAGRRLGWRFTCMKTREGYRVWRVE